MDFQNKEKNKEINKNEINIGIKQDEQEQKKDRSAGTVNNPDSINIIKQDDMNVINLKEVPGAQIKQFQLVTSVRKMSKAEVEARRKLFPKEEKSVHENAIVGFGYKKPVTHAQVAALRTNLNVKVMAKNEKGEDYVKSYKWADNVSQELRDHIDWLMEYHKIHNNTLDEYREKDSTVLPQGNYDVSVEGLNKIYEYQGKTLNCYGCAGTAMLNQYFRNKNKEAEPKLLFNQHDLRNYRPRIKKYGKNMEGLADVKNYDDQVRNLDTYAGPGRTAVGNVFQLGDFFLEKLEGQNAQLNKMYIQNPVINSTDEAEKARVENNIKAVFKAKLNEVLSTGNVVSLLMSSSESGHYITITGLHGDEVDVLDSLHEGEKKDTRPISKIMKGLMTSGSTLELAWISDMQDPGEMTRKYSNLTYDEEKGYGLREKITDNALAPGQTLGIAVRRTMEEMGPGTEGISEVAYIPNPLAVQETETIDEFLKKSDEAIAKAKKEKAEKEKAEKERAAKEKLEREKQEREKAEKEKAATDEKVREKEEYREVQLEKKKEIIEEDQKESLENEAEESDLKATKKQLKWEQIEGKLSKAEKKYWKEKKTEDKEALKKYEEKNKDYAAFGVGFDLKHVKVNAADSTYMADIKNALSNYLELRKSIFGKRHIADMNAAEMHVKRNREIGFDAKASEMEEEYRKLGLISKGKPILIHNENDELNLYELGDVDRQDLGRAYDAAIEAVNTYLMGRQWFFKYGRGKARLKQVEAIKDSLMIDNMRFMLSENRRGLLKSLDAKYERRNGKESKWEDKRKTYMPTWLNTVKAYDTVELGSISMRRKREAQKRLGVKVSLGERLGDSFTHGFRTGFRLPFIAIGGIAGLVDRGLGLGTMVAANSLELAGKVVKAPLKMLSGIFNWGSKKLGSKKRWRMDYSLKTGWKSLDDGRKIFRRYLKGACVLPAAVLESVFRGVPYIFGHKFKSPVYKRTLRWSNDIFNDVGNVIGSITGRKYYISERGDAELREDGGWASDHKGNFEFVKGNYDNADEDEELDDFEEELKERKLREKEEKEIKEEPKVEEKEEEEEKKEKKGAEKEHKEEPEVEVQENKDKKQDELEDILNSFDENVADEKEIEKKEEPKEEKEEKEENEEKETAPKVDFTSQLWANYDNMYNNLKDKSHYSGKGANMYRDSAAFVELIAMKKGDSMMKSSETFADFMIDTKYATAEEKTRNAMAWERIFEVVLEADMSRFKIDKVSDIVDGKYDDIVQLLKAMWGMHEENLDAYEKMINDANVKTALTAEQLSEVRARWDYIHTGFQFIKNIFMIKDLFKKYKIDPDKELKRSHDELDEMRDEYSISYNKEDREKGRIYSELVLIKDTCKLNKVKKVSSLSGTYKTYRSRYKLEKKDYSKDAIDAIRNRREEAFVHDIQNEYKEFYLGAKEKEQGHYYGIGTIEYRKSAQYVKLLSENKGESREKCFEIYKTFLIQNPTKEEMNKKAYCWERVFEVILEADMNKLNITKLSDVVSGSLDSYNKLIFAMFEIEESFLDNYEKMIEDPEVKCALTKEQLAEVRVRWEYIQCGLGSVSNIIASRDLIKKYKFDLDKAVMLDEEELEKKIKKYGVAYSVGFDDVSRDKRTLYNLASSIKDSMGLSKIGSYTELPAYYENLRKKYKITKDGTAGALKAIRARQAGLAETGAA